MIYFYQINQMILFLIPRYKRMAILKNLVKALLVLALLATLLIHNFLTINYASQVIYNGEKVIITRDQYNIPDLNAPSFASAMYAWGYVTAEDRQFQIGFRRQVGQGRLSEIVGEKGLPLDKMMRQIDFYGWSIKTQQRFKKQNITEYNNFQAYVQGINDCANKKKFLPFQYYILGLQWHQWTMADSFLLYKLLKWSQSQNMVDQYYRSLLLSTMTKQQVDKILAYQPQYWLSGQYATQSTIVKDDEIDPKFYQSMKTINAPKFTKLEIDSMVKVGLVDFLDQGARGSNSWVIGGKLTESGHPLLCNDPHLDSALPGQWQQIRVNYKKNGQHNYLAVASLAGIPIFIGKSSYFTLSMTTTYSDSQDLFKETLNDNNQYLYEGKWLPLKVRNQIITIKGGSQYKHTVRQTHHGPIVKNIGYRGYMYEITNQDISLCWGGNSDREYDGLKDIVHIAEIRNYETLIKMIKKMSHHAPPMNMVYITADDHFGYISVGPQPKRRHPHMGMYVQDGSKAQNQWLGFQKPEQRLHIHDTKRGYIVTANNKPSSKNFQNGIFDITMQTARADRIEAMIRQRIASGKKMDKDFMKQMQLDTIDPYCQEIVKAIPRKLKENRNKYEEIFGTFQNFDCNFSRTATIASVYMAFYQNVMEEVKPEAIKNILSVSINYPFNQYIQTFIHKAHTDDQIAKLKKAKRQAMAELQQIFGTSDINKYKYSQFHQDLMKHRPFSESKVLKPFFESISEGWGNQNTPNVGVMAKLEDKDYKTDHRANIRLIMSYHQPSEWIIDGGTSEAFYSKHFTDQKAVFFQDKYILMDSKNKNEKTDSKKSDL